MDISTLIGQTNVQPRPYQQRIVGKVVDLFANKGLRSILLESPTGSGKTVMGLLAARALQERLGLTVGWVAMRRFLLAQAEEENRTRGINVEASYISMFDKNPPTGIDLLVVDEAQHDAAQSMAVLHQKIQPRYILGLSATPFRADRVKLCFDSVIKDAGIQTLIQDGYLSTYHHYTIPTFSTDEVAKHYLRDQERWGRSILYFHTLDQAFRANKLLVEGGVRADVVTGSSDREQQLADFRAGRLQVLTNCMLLSEGFDCPELRTVFVRPSCKGLTIQMAGRVLRKHPSEPVKQIVQCTRTRWPFQRTAKAEQAYTWTEDMWRSLTVNPKLNEVNGRMLRALAKIEVTLPDLLQRRLNSRRRSRREQDDWQRFGEE
jgi:superfamily II DNA or RNA helicase